MNDDYVCRECGSEEVYSAHIGLWKAGSDGWEAPEYGGTDYPEEYTWCY